MSDTNLTPKIVKGGFRATLALLLSIVALIFSILAYQESGNQKDLASQVKNLQKKLDSVRENTSKQIDKIGEETSSALKKFGIEINKK